jgi:hypothetical protein
MVAYQENNIAAADFATTTSVGLLDALLDAMTLARPGHDAGNFAADLKRLGDGAARAAYELDSLLGGATTAAEPVDAPRRRANAG